MVIVSYVIQFALRICNYSVQHCSLPHTRNGYANLGKYWEMRFCSAIIGTWIIAIVGVACSGSGTDSGESARKDLESRTGVKLAPGAGDVRSGWVWVGDTYGEYFRFSCDAEYVVQLAEELSLKTGRVSGTGSLWERAAGRTTPNTPAWWVRAADGSVVYYKEDYSEITIRSVMTLHYDEEQKSGFLTVRLWD